MSDDDDMPPIDFKEVIAKAERERAISCLTQSPIESMLVEALFKQCAANGYEVVSSPRGPHSLVAIEPNRQYGRHRLDFLITYIFYDNVLTIDVECDGHDYHERTELQARRDKNRDVLMQRYGLFVIRFTGTQIVRDPLRCAGEILEIIMDFQTQCFMEATTLHAGSAV